MGPPLAASLLLCTTEVFPGTVGRVSCLRQECGRSSDSSCLPQARVCRACERVAGPQPHWKVPGVLQSDPKISHLEGGDSAEKVNAKQTGHGNNPGNGRAGTGGVSAEAWLKSCWRPEAHRNMRLEYRSVVKTFYKSTEYLHLWSGGSLDVCGRSSGSNIVRTCQRKGRPKFRP